MSDPLTRVTAGAPLHLRAPTLNALIDAARREASERDFRDGKFGRGQRGPGGHGITPAVEILVRNDTGGDLDARAVLAIGAPLIDPAEYPADVQRRPMFAGDAVASSSDPFAILAEPIPAGAIGRAVVQGVAVVDLTVTSTVDTHAGPAAGNTSRLVTGGGPAVILSTLVGTGSQRGVVLLGGTNDLAWGADNEFFGGWAGHTTYPDPPDAFSIGTAEIVPGSTNPDATTAYTVFDPNPVDPYQPGPVCIIPAGSGRVMVRAWVTVVAWNEYGFAAGAGEKLRFTVWGRLVNIDGYGDPAQWIPAGGLFGGEQGTIGGELTAWVPVLSGQWYATVGAPTGHHVYQSLGGSREAWYGSLSLPTTLNVGDQEARVCWQLTVTGLWASGPSASPDVDAIQFRAVYLGPELGDTTGTAIEYQQVRPASRLGYPDQVIPGTGSGGAGLGPWLLMPRG